MFAWLADFLVDYAIFFGVYACFLELWLRWRAWKEEQEYEAQLRREREWWDELTTPKW